MRMKLIMGKVLSNKEVFKFAKETYEHKEFALLPEDKGKYALMDNL